MIGVDEDWEGASPPPSRVCQSCQAVESVPCEKISNVPIRVHCNLGRYGNAASQGCPTWPSFTCYYLPIVIRHIAEPKDEYFQPTVIIYGRNRHTDNDATERVPATPGSAGRHLPDMPAAPSAPCANASIRPSMFIAAEGADVTAPAVPQVRASLNKKLNCRQLGPQHHDLQSAVGVYSCCGLGINAAAKREPSCIGGGVCRHLLPSVPECAITANSEQLQPPSALVVTLGAAFKLPPSRTSHLQVTFASYDKWRSRRPAQKSRDDLDEALIEYDHKVGGGASNRLKDVIKASNVGRVL